jgi:hypothetical protein
MKHLLPLLTLLALIGLQAADEPAPVPSPAMPDVPFPQPVSRQFSNHPDLGDVAFKRLLVDREDRVHVLSDRGLCRLVGDQLALDRQFRPLVGRTARDITLARGELWQLFDREFLCNGLTGRFVADVGEKDFRAFAVGPELSALLVGPTNAVLFREPQFLPLAAPRSLGIERVYAGQGNFYTLSPDTIRRVRGNQLELFHAGSGLTSLAFRTNQVLVGTRNGYYGLDPRTGGVNLPLQDRLPWNEITSLAIATNGIWAGTSRGTFLHAGMGMFRYFAGRRWLKDDHVIDLAVDASGNLFVLTRSGLSEIAFPRMTLEDKARHFEQKIRQRHMRYGFSSELHLRAAGDPASAELVDTDNDGSWSSYYLASQALHFGATGEESARQNAWETFATLERLQAIAGLNGFPARTFERTGFKVSDPDRWRPAADPRWEWKGHTSSDEITAQTFAYAVLYETCATTVEERNRIATAYDRIMSHILGNNLHLVDADGRPTLWGRWHPDYVNSYPPTIVDRRLLSSEIVAFLQFAHRITGRPAYRQRATELLVDYGYLQNITNTMADIRVTSGHVYEGHDMGDRWNHSDDLLAFVNYWTLCRYALTDHLRRQFADAVRDHWDIERIERNPLWSFVLASTGDREGDILGALWTLRSFPLDLVTWDVSNSHRRDIVRLQSNFRGQETRSLLPPGERPTTRWNGNPFQLDGGDGGHTELAGDEFLLPYWMGRYLRLIAPPAP